VTRAAILYPGADVPTPRFAVASFPLTVTGRRIQLSRELAHFAISQAVVLGVSVMPLIRPSMALARGSVPLATRGAWRVPLVLHRHGPEASFSKNEWRGKVISLGTDRLNIKLWSWQRSALLNVGPMTSQVTPVVL
jgi:hypothetical protein